METSRFERPHAVIPAPSVIPAQAGIHVRGAAAKGCMASGLDPRLHGDDEELVIPAQAGIHARATRLDPRLRGDDEMV